MSVKQGLMTKSGAVSVTPGLVAVLIATLVSFVAHSDSLVAGPPVEQPIQRSYQPAEDFETEFRAFLELSGQYDSLRDLYRLSLEEVDRLPENFRDLVLRELQTPDDVVELIMPMYRRYFSLQDLQQVNEVYSTERMRDFFAKAQLVQQEALPLALEAQQRSLERVMEKLARVSVDELRRRSSPLASVAARKRVS